MRLFNLRRGEIADRCPACTATNFEEDGAPVCGDVERVLDGAPVAAHTTPYGKADECDLILEGSFPACHRERSS